jgi:hypothetical protein
VEQIVESVNRVPASVILRQDPSLEEGEFMRSTRLSNVGSNYDRSKINYADHKQALTKKDSKNEKLHWAMAMQD